MPETPSERRLTENEVVFRRLNEQLHKGYEETNRLAQEDNQPEFAVDPDDNQPLSFLCECSDENCLGRININFHDYDDIHQHNDRFVVMPGHEVTSIEEVILEQPEYYVVNKFTTPPENASSLQPTSVDNS